MIMYSVDQVKRGITNPKMAIRHFKVKALQFLDASIYTLGIGTSIYDRDWDVLIVLDACRVDLFEEFAPQHNVFEKFNSVSSIRSVASSTEVWLPRTFDNGPDELVANTHYVPPTAYAERMMNGDRLHDIDHVWKYAESPEYGYTKIEAITDAGIEAIRKSDADRVVIHYTPPHAPFMHCVGKYRSGPNNPGSSQAVWWELRAGEFDCENVWEDYGKNLLRVLDEVETVIENSSGKVVITSDHGNGMGEWGVYGHPAWAINSEVRRVPWATATGESRRNYEIEGREKMSTKTQTVEENLRALGYRE